MPKKTTRITRPTLMTTWHRKRPQTRQSFVWNVGMHWSREALNKVGQKQILKDKRKNPRVGSPKPMFYILYYQLGVCHPKWLFQGWSLNQPEIADLDVTSGLSAAPVGPRWDFFSMTRWPWVTHVRWTIGISKLVGFNKKSSASGFFMGKRCHRNDLLSNRSRWNRKELVT